MIFERYGPFWGKFALSDLVIGNALGLSLVHTIKTWSALRKAGLFEQRFAKSAAMTAEKSSDSNVVVVLRGQKYRVALQPDKGVWRGRLDVGTQFGDDLYVE